jgi:hypothetical protein
MEKMGDGCELERRNWEKGWDDKMRMSEGKVRIGKRDGK